MPAFYDIRFLIYHIEVSIVASNTIYTNDKRVNS